MKDKLNNSLREAMKAKDAERLGALRLALTAIKNAEIEKGEELEDARIFNILQKEIKMKEETISEAKKAGRDGMIAPLEREIIIIKEFLPKELSDEDLSSLIDTVINAVGAESIKQMGLVMKSVIEKVQGQASNDRISRMVRDKLSN